MDVHGGLPELLEIEWRGRRFSQRLDYLGIPLCCYCCHKTCHLKKNCPGWAEKEPSKDSALLRDLVDHEEEVHYVCKYPIPEPTFPSDSKDSFLGKLKIYCPSFYHSLTFLEIAKLKDSKLLKCLHHLEALPTFPNTNLSTSFPWPRPPYLSSILAPLHLELIRLLDTHYIPKLTPLHHSSPSTLSIPYLNRPNPFSYRVFANLKQGTPPSTRF